MLAPMACCGSMNFTCELVPNYYPPRALGGWQLIGVPPGTPELVAALMEEGKKWKGQTFNEPVNKVLQFLQSQGVETTTAVEQAVWAWANAQWCAKDPPRCPKKLVSARAEGEVGKPIPMSWAGDFWETWNLALSSPGDPVLINRSFIFAAGILLSGPHGCPDCARNWPRHLAEWPYQLADDQLKARVWLWHVHNLTREGQKPTSYNLIAARYGWTQLPSSALTAVLNSLIPKAPTAEGVLA